MTESHEVDKDNVGKVSVEELKNELKANTNFDEAMITAELEKIDKNHDGEITMEELNRAIGGGEPERPSE